MSLRRASAWSTGGTLVARIGGALGGLVVAVILGPAGRGTYALWTVGATIAGMMALGGLQFWVITQSARGADSVRTVLGRHAALAAGALGMAGVVAALALDGSARTEALASLALVAATIASTLALAVPTGRLEMHRLGVGLALGSLSYLALTGLLAAAGFRSVATMLGAAAVAETLMILPCLASLRSLPVSAGAAGYGMTLRAYVPAAVGETALYSAQRVDVFVVAAFLPLADVGRYSVATAMAEILMVLPDGISQVLLPGTAVQRGDGASRRFDAVVRWTVVSTLVGGALLASVARPLLNTLLGSGYREAAVAMPWLVPGAAALATWKLVGARLVGVGDISARTVGAVAALVIMVACDLVFVPVWGLRGAAAVSSLSYLVAAIVVVRRWRRRRPGEAAELPLVPSSAPAAGSLPGSTAAAIGPEIAR